MRISTNLNDSETLPMKGKSNTAENNISENVRIIDKEPIIIEMK